MCVWRVCVCVALHLYVSPSPGAHDRKEVLEVARNADCELSTVSPLLKNQLPLNQLKFSSLTLFTQPAPADLYIGSFVLQYVHAQTLTQNSPFENSSFYVKRQRSVI